MSKNKNKPSVISLFSGAGGMDLGFIQAGYDVAWANDFDEDSVKTYKKNIGEDIILGDITQMPNSVIPNNADIVIGGFPCQGFSISNPNRKKHGMNDERNFLYKEMLRVIDHVEPKYFVAENVKGILNLEKGSIMPLIINDFKELGYNVDFRLFDTSLYGVPQRRERVIIIGNRVGQENPFPEQTHGELNNKNGQLAIDGINQLKPIISTKQAIGHLKNIKTSSKPKKLKSGMLYNHEAYENVHETFFARKYNPNQHDICDYLKYWRNKAGISTNKIDQLFGYAHTAGHWFRKDNNSGSIPKPDDWWKLKKILGFDDKYDKAVTVLEEREVTFEQSLRITNWDRPSDTITATSPEIHINKMRRLSARECAILQTFPDDFVFEGSLPSTIKQIGNAVPVLFARKIAEALKSQL